MNVKLFKTITHKKHPKELSDIVPTIIHGNLTGPEQRILDAIAWSKSIGIHDPEQVAVAFLAGYRYGGGAFMNPRGRLKQMGMIAYNGKKISLTDKGVENANVPTKQATTEELHSRVLARLSGPETRILKPLLSAWPGALSTEVLARQANYSELGGAFNNPKGRLRTLGLISYPIPGHVVASNILFPDDPFPRRDDLSLLPKR